MSAVDLCVHINPCKAPFVPLLSEQLFGDEVVVGVRLCWLQSSSPISLPIRARSHLSIASLMLQQLKSTTQLGFNS